MRSSLIRSSFSFVHELDAGNNRAHVKLPTSSTRPRITTMRDNGFIRDGFLNRCARYAACKVVAVGPGLLFERLIVVDADSYGKVLSLNLIGQPGHATVAV